MSTVIDKIEKEQMRDLPSFGPGDTVKVHQRVIEGGKERIQIFQGIVLSRQGTGLNQAATVRKISNGEGVERVFQLHSPKIAQVEVTNLGDARRAKLNFLRDRLGKSATTVRPAKSGWKLKLKAEPSKGRKKKRRSKKDKGNAEALAAASTAAAAAEAPQAAPDPAPAADESTPASS